LGLRGMPAAAKPKQSLKGTWDERHEASKKSIDPQKLSANKDTDWSWHTSITIRRG